MLFPIVVKDGFYTSEKQLGLKNIIVSPHFSTENLGLLERRPNPTSIRLTWLELTMFGRRVQDSERLCFLSARRPSVAPAKGDCAEDHVRKGGSPFHAPRRVKAPSAGWNQHPTKTPSTVTTRRRNQHLGEGLRHALWPPAFTQQWCKPTCKPPGGVEF